MTSLNRFLPRAMVCGLAVLIILSFTLIAFAGNNISVQVICKIGVGVANARVILYRVEANGDTRAEREKRTDKNGKVNLNDLDPGTYEVRVICSGGGVFTRKVSFGGGVEESHAYVLRCCPPAPGVPPSPDGLISIDGKAVIEETPSSPGAKTAKVVTANGLHTASFDTNPGWVTLNLPDDMRAGDTISGTVVAEPKGNTEEERKNNAAKLSEFKLNFGSQFPKDKEELMIFVRPRIIIRDDVDPPPSSSGNFTAKLPDTFNYTIGGTAPRTDEATVTITINSMVWFINDQATTPGTQPPASSNPFEIPELSQQGRPLEIFGPFDGNASNTTLKFGPPTSTVKDFEKGTENVSGGFGIIKPLAESPRKIVFESPSNVTGPVTILVKEGDGAPTTGTMRNVGVNLSAPKTNLMRGEKTTVTVRVSGLEGIKEDVPLQLDSKGVITMDGGTFQNLRIKPNEVKSDGTYTTSRGITGQQAGGFTVTATVIVRRFDFTLQDDTDPNRLFHFNSFTGDYIFACGGGSCRPGGSTGGTQTGGTPGKPGGTVQPGGTTQPGGTPTPPIVPPTGVNLTGIGRPAMKGCIITLSHNAPDRRVFARLDACTKSGDASVQTNSPKAEVNITDKNTTDNTAPSPPPK